jgi:hypothetical protein
MINNQARGFLAPVIIFNLTPYELSAVSADTCSRTVALTPLERASTQVLHHHCVSGIGDDEKSANRLESAGQNSIDTGARNLAPALRIIIAARTSPCYIPPHLQRFFSNS